MRMYKIWVSCPLGDNKTQKMMNSNDTRLTVAIYDLIISEGLSFNLSQKPRFKKVLDLVRTVSKCYQPPNRKLISKDILDVIHAPPPTPNRTLLWGTTTSRYHGCKGEHNAKPRRAHRHTTESGNGAEEPTKRGYPITNNKPLWATSIPPPYSQRNTKGPLILHQGYQPSHR